MWRLFVLRALRLFEIARVLVRLDHVASYFQATGRFLKRWESKKSLKFPELALAVSVENH